MITIDGLKSHKISEDGQNLAVTFSARFIKELELSIPLDCLGPIINALTEAKPQVDAPETSDETPNSNQLNSVRVTAPRNCHVWADLQRASVVMVFDHQLDTQAGYAFTAESAKQVAFNLMHYADAVLAK